jgi:hypothetical protein
MRAEGSSKSWTSSTGAGSSIKGGPALAALAASSATHLGPTAAANMLCCKDHCGTDVRVGRGGSAYQCRSPCRCLGDTLVLSAVGGAILLFHLCGWLRTL